jgi:hypothetical protein
MVAWECRGHERPGSVLGIIKEHKETFGSDGYLHCFDCGDTFTGLHTCVKI